MVGTNGPRDSKSPWKMSRLISTNTNRTSLLHVSTGLQSHILLHKSPLILSATILAIQ